MKKNNIVWIEGHFERTDEEPVNRIAVFQQEKNELKEEIIKLKTQIGKMKCDILSLVKDRMNDDVDQNAIERLAEKWGIKEK